MPRRFKTEALNNETPSEGHHGAKPLDSRLSAKKLRAYGEAIAGFIGCATAPPPPPFSAELLAAAARFVPGAWCLCLIVVGALAPLCFLFSVFQNARPPATPRRLGPPLTERSKTLGPGASVRPAVRCCQCCQVLSGACLTGEVICSCRVLAELFGCCCQTLSELSELSGCCCC